MDDNEIFEETDLGLLGDDDWTGLFSPTHANTNTNTNTNQLTNNTLDHINIKNDNERNEKE